jgi:predicted nucleic acid-binding protein
VVFESVQPGELDPKTTLVVDNSVMMRWLFDDGSVSDRRYARKILSSIQDSNINVIVPHIWVYESSFVVNYYVNRGELESAEATRHLDALFNFCSVTVDRETSTALFEFSNTLGVSTYDAAYLMLAQAQNSALATLDKKMRRVAKKLDIQISPDRSK